MKRLVWLILGMVVCSVPAFAQGAAATPSPAPAPAAAASPDAHAGHDHGQAMPSPSPEERPLLEKMERLKSQPPKNDAEDQKMRKEYTALLKEYVKKFPATPRTPQALQALVQLLATGNQVPEAEQTAKEFQASAKGPQAQMFACALLVDLYMNVGQEAKAIGFLLDYLKQGSNLGHEPMLAYKLAGLLSDQDRYGEAIGVLESFLKKEIPPAQMTRFELRIADLHISAGRPKDAIDKLEALRKLQLSDEDKSLSTYFLGMGHAALSKALKGPDSERARKKAFSFFDTLMTGARKDINANYPYGAMAFSAAADLLLSTGDKAGALKLYEEMGKLYKERPEGMFAERAAKDAAWTGKQAPDFSGPTLDGKTVTLKELAGKLVLLDFWATWCQPCIGEIPLLKRIAKNAAGRPLAIVSVSLDNPKQLSQLKRFVDMQGLTWSQVHDGKVWESPIVKKYEVTGIPACFLIDEKGQIVRSGLRGHHLKDVIQQELARLDQAKQGK
ncbi:MAG: redoxin domain-containing protein [Candidatus Riflebacteria bacterium]|nr:redoxin domain-containing protein [Candidatus Riflebacteria bacterium]